MSQANMDLGILQETKLTNGVYTRRSAGYSVIATDEPSGHRGGTAIFYRSEPHFVVEAVEKFGPNFVGFQLATGARRWYIVGVYLAPEDTTTMERVSEALRSKPRGAELLVTGDFSVYLASPEGYRRAEEIATSLATEGLEDMARHFLPWESRWCRDRRTWGMIRKGREVRSRTEYILGTDRRLFRNVAVRDPWHNSDHYMVLGCIPSTPPTEHKRDLGGRKRWTVRPPREQTRTYELFTALRRAVLRAQTREARRNAWILELTWRLINERVSARRDPQYGRAFKIRQGKAVKKSLAADRRRRADEAGAEVEAMVKAEPPLIQEAWYRLQGWYKAAVDRAPPPARATLKRVTAEWVALYSRVPPTGYSIPVNIEPFAVEDGVPEEGEIEWAVKCQQNNRAGGLSRMQAKDLTGGLVAARRGEKEREAAVKDGGIRKDKREGAEN